MAERLRTAGRDVDVVLLDGRGHAYGPDGNEAALNRTTAFFRVHLGRQSRIRASVVHGYPDGDDPDR